MFTRLIVLTLLLTSLKSSLPAQNIVLALAVGDSINGVVKVKEGDSYCDDCLDYNVSPAPSALISAIPFKIHYEEGANYVLNNFQHNHLNWSYNVPGDFFYPVLGGLGGAIPIPEEFEEEYGYEHHKRGYEKLKEVILGSSFVRELIYDWIMPSYVKAYSLMSAPEQKDFMKLLTDARDYVKIFNIEAEREEANSNADFAADRGYIGAFFYRRISNGEMSREECLEWLERAIADFNAVIKKNPTVEDGYVLSEKLNYGYFVAKRYDDDDWWEGGSEIMIFRREGTEFHMLPGLKPFWSDQYVHNIFFGRRKTPGGEWEKVMFYSDSLTWTCTVVPRYFDPEDIVQKGTGTSSRLLLIEDVDYDVEMPVSENARGAYCAVVDVDSGYLVVDSVMIPTGEILEAASSYSGHSMPYTHPTAKNEYMKFWDPKSKKYGMIDGNGNMVLAPKYKTIEPTDDPKVFRVNGKKKIKVS